MEICLVYLSSPVGTLREEDLTAILHKSRQNNSRSGVTGVLLYIRGSIIQVLEGEKATVETLYKRIAADPRHTDVTRVLSRPIGERLFRQWDMGYDTLTVQQLHTIKDVLALDASGKAVVDASDPLILKTIKVFYESNRHN